MRGICLSNKTYKLEQDPYTYQLQDVTEPELFREIYPYTETPKIPFNYRRVRAFSASAIGVGRDTH